MALFKKNRIAGDPIANRIPVDLTKEDPLSGGNNLAVNSLMRQLPFNMGSKNMKTTVDNAEDNSSMDDEFSPNLFGSWADIYEAFMGSFKLVSAPPEIKRHQKGIKHLLFISNQAAIYRGWEDRYIIGSLTVKESDEYGRVISGTFIPFNYFKYKFDDSKSIDIQKGINDDMVASMSLNIYSIPLFLTVKYFCNLRRMLYQFKNVNLRLSTINTVVGVKGGGREILEPFIKDLFNLDSRKFPAPIQILDININQKNGDMDFNFVDLQNQIKINVEYRGNDINLDIDSVTKELFRVAGLRYDTSASSGTFQDRPSKSQVNQASNYFDARENSMLEAFENFSYDCKQLFGFDMVWESIYNFSQEVLPEENEDNKKDNEKDGI